MSVGLPILRCRTPYPSLIGDDGGSESVLTKWSVEFDSYFAFCGSNWAGSMYLGSLFEAYEVQ